MGGCLGSPRRISYPDRDSSEVSGGVSIGRNQPLRRECPKWKSDIPISEEHLRRRRDEFWDTAPAFEGHREIWDALKVAATAVEMGDFDLAQAIIDGAGISLPNGNLSDCYDELGTRYQLPSYVLSKPTNLLPDNENSKTAEKSHDLKVLPSMSEKLKDHKSCSTSRGSEIVVKLQLSTGKDLKTTVRTSDPILRLKEFVSQSENIPPSKQRMFFAGTELQNCIKVKEARIKKNYVVQVVVASCGVEEQKLLTMNACSIGRGHKGSVVDAPLNVITGCSGIDHERTCTTESCNHLPHVHIRDYQHCKSNVMGFHVSYSSVTHEETLNL